MKTLTVDDKQRVRLLDVKPHTKLFYQKDPDGRITLTPDHKKNSSSTKVRFLKRDGRTVASIGHPISVASLQVALADFP